MATKKRKTAKKHAKPIGRPSKLTPELHAKIIKWRVAQYSMIDIARLSGVSRENIRNWLQRGATDKGTEAEKRLVREYDEAEGKLVGEATEALIDALAARDFNATKFVLERLHRSMYGVGVQKIAITDTEGKDVPPTPDYLTKAAEAGKNELAFAMLYMRMPTPAELAVFVAKLGHSGT